ncbi:hypothetical protein [Pseudonocardia alaniniphila]|uniref:Uncharacterized protein n=1 Tax=Pseudonocardia alaniniphila TaxID=75291 RepID=A0ABS9TJP4_9PSEU|nr:hypothetical protein [Pseudonocardia alaniniphila]MCH6168766.1 hypothetical protein [Pseudonocardia alaniniphila]
MSLIVPRFDDSVVVRSGEAEVVGRAPTAVGPTSHLERIAYGKVPPESLWDVQELYDNWFTSSPAWEAARATT